MKVKFWVAAQWVALGLATYFTYQWMNVGLRPIVNLAQPTVVKNNTVPPANCAPLWVSGASNDMWLQCELTSNLRRYCGEDGRELLVANVKWYMVERDGFDRAIQNYLLKVQRNYAAGRAPDPIIIYAEAQAKAGAEFAKTGHAAGLSATRLSDAEITALLTTFAIQGLLHKSDFAEPQPSYLASAFVGLSERVPNPGC